MYAKKREVKEQKEKLLEHQDDSKNIKVNSNIESKLSEKSKLVELFKKRIANLERQLMTSRSETSGIKKILGNIILTFIDNSIFNRKMKNKLKIII